MPARAGPGQYVSSGCDAASELWSEAAALLQLAFSRYATNDERAAGSSRSRPDLYDKPTANACGSDARRVSAAIRAS